MYGLNNGVTSRINIRRMCIYQLKYYGGVFPGEVIYNIFRSTIDATINPPAIRTRLDIQEAPPELLKSFSHLIIDSDA